MDWLTQAGHFFSFEYGGLILTLSLLLCCLVLAISIRGIGEIIRESVTIRQDAAAMISGDLMSFEKKKRMVRIKKRISGLSAKLTSFTMALVLAVTALASLPLYLIITQNQKRTQIKGLWDRAAVLAESLAANARMYLSHENINDVGNLHSQMVSIPEAMYVTITGYNPETLVFEDQVWASNDPGLLQKIDNPVFRPGYSRLTDAISGQIRDLARILNAEAHERFGDFPATLASLSHEAEELAEQAEWSDAPEIKIRLEEIYATVRVLESRIADVLIKISGELRSEPAYSFETLDTTQNRRFIFYRPIMYRHGTEDNFFWGVVRLEVSVSTILNQIETEKNELIRIYFFVALAAQIIGAIGALVLSAFIIRPIKQLVRHIEIIRDTVDMTKLAGVNIKLKSRDELAVLGDTINDMTHGLVKAALAASELSIGKQFQKKFIPLELDHDGNKLNSGFEENGYFNLFGYYEGANNVSGDYFDYQDLDGRYYAIIKCDVAGKGVPASFIMIQVVTMFLNYFKYWEPTEEGMGIERLVYQINDFIEHFAYRDRFASFTLCLYDSHTGTARFCNAGDNIVHLYAASEKALRTIYLPSSPAAGVLSNFMVESKGGYTVQTLNLDHGDMLLLYTDGIEESLRKFRSADFKEIICTDGTVNAKHENHTSGQGVEELGYERIKGIVESVMNKQIYTLHRWHNPEGDMADLHFDFRTCEGTVREVIMAIISIEKAFRCYYNPRANVDDRVLVEKQVDSFLKTHFIQYRNYFSFAKENPGNHAYVSFTHLMEDEQYDDLTVMGFKRK